MSGLLIGLDYVSVWLTQRPELAIDQDIVLAATISHHLKADLKTLAQPSRPGLSSVAPKTTETLTKCSNSLQTGSACSRPLPKFTMGFTWGYKDSKGQLQEGLYNIDPLLTRLKDSRLAPFKKKLRNDDAVLRMLWAVRAALIAADAAASGLRGTSPRA